MLDIKKIAGDSLHTKKPKRAEVIGHLKQVVELINRGPADAIEGHLASIYAFFDAARPSKKAADDVFAWVAQAVTKDKTRPALALPYSDKDRTLVATDGRRVHWVDEAGYDADTFYTMGARPVKVEFKFPGWTQIVPRGLPGRQLMPDVEYCPKPAHYAPKGVARFKASGIDFVVNGEYLRQALNGMKDPDIRFADAVSPIHISDGTRNAVIMPLRP